MIFFYALQALLALAAFGLAWKLFGRKIYRRITEERVIANKLLDAREKLAALPAPDSETHRARPRDVENLRAEYEREIRELQARLDRVRGNLQP